MAKLSTAAVLQFFTQWVQADPDAKRYAADRFGYRGPKAAKANADFADPKLWKRLSKKKLVNSDLVDLPPGSIDEIGYEAPEYEDLYEAGKHGDCVIRHFHPDYNHPFSDTFDMAIITDPADEQVLLIYVTAD
jgi:hypothetical protein